MKPGDGEGMEGVAAPKPPNADEALGFAAAAGRRHKYYDNYQYESKNVASLFSSVYIFGCIPLNKVIDAGSQAVGFRYLHM